MSSCCAPRCSRLAPEEDAPVKHFTDLAQFSREQVLALLALAQRLQEHPEPQALAAAVESSSEHPLGRAIVAAAPPAVTEEQEAPPAAKPRIAKRKRSPA